MQKKLLSEDHTVRDVLCVVVPGHLVAVEAERALAAGVDGLDGFLFAVVIELVVLPDAVAVVDIEAFAVFIKVAAHRPLAVLPGAAGPVDVDLDGVVGNTLDIDRAAVAAVTALETLDRAAGSFRRLLSRFLSGFLRGLLRGFLSCFLGLFPPSFILSVLLHYLAHVGFKKYEYEPLHLRSAFNI